MTARLLIAVAWDLIEQFVDHYGRNADPNKDQYNRLIIEPLEINSIGWAGSTQFIQYGNVREEVVGER